MQFNKDVLLVAQGGGVMSPEILTGVYQAFEESGTIPGRVLASSGGALFSGLYYSQKDAAWFKDLMQNKDLSEWISVAPIQATKMLVSKSNYMLDNTGLKDFLIDNMTLDAMSAVQVSVTRLNDYTGHLKPATPMWVLAATSIPFLFRPVKHGISVWGDGGILNNIPMPSADIIKDFRRVYVVCTPPSKYTGDLYGISGLLELLTGVMDRELVQLKQSGYLDMDNVVFIQPPEAHGGSLLQWSKDFQMREQSYQMTKQILKTRGV